jgi:hypothetical protein
MSLGALDQTRSLVVVASHDEVGQAEENCCPSPAVFFRTNWGIPTYFFTDGKYLEERQLQ